ncbi:MAG: hypothetical protein PUF37_02290 [Prevotellaceae bacterium]|nr:hypothetical protein [Prevotellaceae bacterium]
MNQESIHPTENIRLSENIIIADGDYIDRVAFALSVQFERMIGRRIPPADLSRWAVDIALDGGLRPGKKQETQLVIIHGAKKHALENFRPANYEEELNGKAFNDEQLGEFLVNAYAPNKLVTKNDYILDLVKTVCSHDEVRRVMVIPDSETSDLYDQLREALRDVDDEKHITLFAMQPLPGGNFRQEILGYSIMNALGIRADEIKG